MLRITRIFWCGPHKGEPNCRPDSTQDSGLPVFYCSQKIINSIIFFVIVKREKRKQIQSQFRFVDEAKENPGKKRLQ